MQIAIGTRRYLFILLATLSGALLLALVNGLLVDRDAMIRCDARDLTEQNYIAGCAAAYFGDYEHAALYLGLEPTATASMSAAQVLLLGNSRLMWAFSTHATAQAFRKLGISYYVLGFGADERVRFPSAIIRKYRLRPRAVIVNVDPFFIDVTNPEYKSLIDGRVEAEVPALFKKYFQRWLKKFCSNYDRFLPVPACNMPAVFRSKADGRWQLQQFRNLTERWPIKANPNLLVGETGKFIAVAQKFYKLLGVPQECVIITSVPSNFSTENAALQLADALHFTYVAPNVSDLRTLDHSHLAPESAERWSAAMLDGAADQLRHCVQ